MSEANSSNETSPFRELLLTPDIPQLGPEPRPGRKALGEIEAKLDQLFSQMPVGESAQAPILSAILLWHDYLDDSHEISQGIHTRDGSFLHGIMHRREPDYSNAKYWFNRVGDHPIFPALATRVEPLIKGKSFAQGLIAGGCWQPFAFVDACEDAAGAGGATEEIDLLRQIQKVEFDLLFEKICRG